MKKITAFIIAAAMLFLLGSCSGKPKTALIIQGAEINSELFAYYLDRVVSSPEGYGLEKTATEKELKDATVIECKKYVASNSEFLNAGNSLSSADKVAISDQVNNIWMRSEKHYESIGVSKQTLTKVVTSEKYAEAVFTKLYDKGREDAAAERAIQNYFYNNYVSFRTVCAYFSSADGTPMTQLEKTEMLNFLTGLSGETKITQEDFEKSFADTGYAVSSTVILKKNSDGYPEGFYDAVNQQSDSTVQTIVYEDCVFVIYKENLAEKGESVYTSYRASCVNDLYADRNDERIEKTIEVLTVEQNDKVIDSVYKKIKD
ncbi:MAG: hypothetical protein J6R20_08975 [Clostridia bacterium]|nr:hypothetical protein [Clostridia bacterium]